MPKLLLGDGWDSTLSFTLKPEICKDMRGHQLCPERGEDDADEAKDHAKPGDKTCDPRNQDGDDIVRGVVLDEIKVAAEIPERCELVGHRKARVRGGIHNRHGERQHKDQTRHADAQQADDSGKRATGIAAGR